MSYKSLRDCAKDLEKNGRLLRIKTEVDPDLEMAEIHRRVRDAQGPLSSLSGSKVALFRRSLTSTERPNKPVSSFAIR